MKVWKEISNFNGYVSHGSCRYGPIVQKLFTSCDLPLLGALFSEVPSQISEGSRAKGKPSHSKHRFFRCYWHRLQAHQMNMHSNWPPIRGQMLTKWLKIAIIPIGLFFCNILFQQITQPSRQSPSNKPYYEAPFGPPIRGAGEFAPEFPFFLRVSWNGISSGSSSSLRHC